MCFIINKIQNFPEGDTVISVDSESLKIMVFQTRNEEQECN